VTMFSDCTCESDAAFLRSPRPPYESIRPTVTVVDLFSGCGGLSLGAAEAARAISLGIDVRLAIDHDPDAVAVYAANLPEADVRLGSVELLFNGLQGAEPSDVELDLKRQIGSVDVLVGGPPCQGHSDLNNHTRRADPRNALYGRMARAAEVLRPTIVLIENVPTVTHDAGRVVEATVAFLRGSGYAVDDAVVDIAQLGAAQRRRRHVVLASRDPRADPSKILAGLESRCEHHPVRTVGWAIRDLIGLQPEALFDSASTPNSENLGRIKWLFEHRKHDLPNALRPECHHSDHSYVSMYGRLAWDKPAQTVTTGFGSMGQGRYVHPARRRTLTPHEAARLQMIPDFWDFGAVSKRGSLATLIGNAVPPILATALLEPALRALNLAPTSEWNAHEPSNEEPRLNKAESPRPPIRRTGIPLASSLGARRRMEATRHKDTTAEVALHAALDALGLEYRTDVLFRAIGRRADIVFDDAGIVAFVDGCFWHACPKHRSAPKANSDWWAQKLEANTRRDRDTNVRLHDEGWLVLRFWEHEDPGAVARSIAAIRSSRVSVGEGALEQSSKSP
jgi:DNA (cytosine-5)-methyltransferase 1